MARRDARPAGAPCHAHDLCEVCHAPICDDCPHVPDACTDHEEYPA